ncbi:MAG: 2OG-Fe(II) oxygenase [Deltaproteobacteria bacterium]|nr:2OG-Fe(II) oxygenase [Deltaproteobacteria bacterium]
MNRPKDFYVVAKEPGAEHPGLPTWANESANPIGLEEGPRAAMQRVEVDGIPGAFQLLNALSPDECRRFIECTESLGYLPDAAVSLPRSVRHNHNVTWVVDEQTDGILWRRCVDFVTDDREIFDDKKPLGLNARFRFYRYQPGDFFRPHTDGAWPGSRVVDRELIADAYPDRFSQMTVLFFLSDEFEGGDTQFWVDKNDPSRPARNQDEVEWINVRTPAGGALCFPHGMHPLHCLHSSEEIVSGVKYIIRTDMLFER